tara:strand:+ start:1600 stop:2244 length:645 start_codon:yes stop_codon:yes gene_type:complete
MDGNNRWSKKNKKSKFNAYKTGSNNLIDLSNYIFENTNSNYVSAFALSKNNLNRSKNLISTLKKVLLEFIEKKINYEFRIKFNVKFIGDKSFLSSEIIKKIKEIENTKANSSKFLLIYINYSGKEDIIQAAQNYCLNNKNNNKVKFEDFLLTKDIPDPDILIRTGGYKRLSDFLLYQTTFTEFFFLNKLWPELTKNDLSKIFAKYYSIERKFGL